MVLYYFLIVPKRFRAFFLKAAAVFVLPLSDRLRPYREFKETKANIDLFLR